jgi:hypothetical protein
MAAMALLSLAPIGQVVSEKKLEMWKVYRRQTTDDGRQVMAIVHLDLWSRWTKKEKHCWLEKTNIITQYKTINISWSKRCYLFCKWLFQDGINVM